MPFARHPGGHVPVRTALPGLLVATALAALALLVPGLASPLAVALVAGVVLANVGDAPLVLGLVRWVLLAPGDCSA